MPPESYVCWNNLSIIQTAINKSKLLLIKYLEHDERIPVSGIETVLFIRKRNGALRFLPCTRVRNVMDRDLHGKKSEKKLHYMIDSIPRAADDCFTFPQSRIHDEP